MDHRKSVRIGNGVKLVCAGAALGVVLRFVQMKWFFDFDTGFYTDGGLTAYLSLLLPLLAAVLGAVCFGRSKSAFGPQALGSRSRKPNRAAGGFAGFSGGVLLALGLMLLRDYRVYRATGFSGYETLRQPNIHRMFMVMCLVFGLVQCAAAVNFCCGGNMFGKAPLLYVVGVLWGMAYLVMVYVFYAKSSSFVENFFAVVGSAALLISLFYLCRLLAGVGEQGAAQRLFIAGGLSSVLVIPYDLTNLVLAMTGRTYFGEMPALYALAQLSVALFVLVYILRYSRAGTAGETDGAPGGPQR